MKMNIPVVPVTDPPPGRGRSRAQRAFTMVEIALCLGVIAFALVAIIGVMPTGLRVQQENRDDTILNADGTVLVEAIRSGCLGIDTNALVYFDQRLFSFGLDSLTNHVLAVMVTNQFDGVQVYWNPHLNRSWNALFGRPARARPPANFVKSPSLTNGLMIVGLLSRPKWEYRRASPTSPLVPVTNYVAALVRAISGPAIEKGGLGAELAFTYVATSEVVPAGVNPNFYPRDWTNFLEANLPAPVLIERSNRWAQVENMKVNFAELRLVLQGPAVPGERVNNVETWTTLGTPKSFRTLLSGRRVAFESQNSQVVLNYLQPGSYQRVGP